MVIGVAGKTCAGKNVIAQNIEKLGYSHVDVDQLGHIALDNEKERLFETFGRGIRNADGSVNRKALGAIVFSDPEEKKKLKGLFTEKPSTSIS